MKLLVNLLIFLNFLNIFSSNCKLTLYFKLQDYKRDTKCSFYIPRKKYTFEEFKKELDNKFKENKTKKDCKKIIEESKKNNYSELLKDYKLLCYNDDYNIDNFTEIDLTGKKEFYLEYSYEIKEKYDFEFYDIEIKEDEKKILAKKFGIKEEEISEKFKNEVGQLNDFLNNKKLFIKSSDIRPICEFLKFEIMNDDDFFKTFKLYINHRDNYNDSIALFDVKKGFSFNEDYFKPIKVTITRRNYDTGKQYGEMINKEISCKCLNLYDCIDVILNNVFGMDSSKFIIKKVNEFEISNIKDIKSYNKELKKLESVLITKEITIEILSEVDTKEEQKKRDEQQKKKMKKETGGGGIEGSEQHRKSKCCFCY